jgi:hypothetical protein
MSRRFVRRRLANAHLYQLKVSYAYSAGWTEAGERLPLLLESSMFSRCPQLAPAASLIGLDCGRACKMSYITRRYEGFLLAQAARDLPETLVGLGSSDDANDMEPAVEPYPWYKIVLLNLIVLSRRSWTYLYLAKARNRNPGVKGRLSEAYLGSSARQAALSRDQSALDKATDALLDLDGEAGHRDPVIDVLGRLEGTPSLPSDECGDRKRAAVEVFKVLSTPPLSYGRSTVSPPLGEALDRVVTVLGQRRDHAVEALRELCASTQQWRALPSGSYDGVAQLPSLQSLLNDVLKNDHEKELPARDVLQNVMAWETGEPAAEPTRRRGRASTSFVPRITQAELRARIEGSLQRDTPQHSVFLAVVIGWRFDDVRSELEIRMPSPRELVRWRPGANGPDVEPQQENLLSEAHKVLRQWKEWLERASAAQTGKSKDEGDDVSGMLELWEIPKEILAQPGSISRVLQWSSGCLQAPAKAPDSWTDSGAKQVVASALLVVLLEEQRERMAEIYENL